MGNGREECDLNKSIVYRGGGDPVGYGLVVSLARPGGTLTGVSFVGNDFLAKRFELLSELVPRAWAIALLVNPNVTISDHVIGDAQDAARFKGLQLLVLEASKDSEDRRRFRVPGPVAGPPR